MADGYARVTWKPTVCYAQHGAAAAILGSMLYEPMYAHSPVVALTGSTPTNKKALWQYQDVDEMPYFEAACKFSVDVTDVDRLAEYMRIAVQVAVSGCPGPTHVNMHLDMAGKATEMTEPYGDPRFFRVPPFRPRAEKDSVVKAAKLLTGAVKPVMVCGSGVHLSTAYNEARALAELLSIPVVTNFKGKGSFPEEHPLSVGVMGSYGSQVANDVVRDADLVFFVGFRPDYHNTEELTAPVPGVPKVIHLDIDPAVFNRKYSSDVALVGDVKATLTELNSVLKKMLAKPKPKKHRVQQIRSMVEEYDKVVEPLMNSEAKPIKPQRMVKEISKILRDEDIIVCDTGQQLCWATRLLRLKDPKQRFLPCGGTLGSSFAMAIGASFGAHDGQRVINLIGDGGILYNISELETAKRYNDEHAPFVAVVNNNSTLGQIRPSFEDWNAIEAPWISYSDFTELDYSKIAEAFGCYGVRVESPGELGEAIELALDSGRPAIVDVVTDKREYAPIGVRRKSLPGSILY
jgi:acetolactate synthase-1/2/3 large subunit